jgi:alpha-1,3-rhamnosyltransferase
MRAEASRPQPLVSVLMAAYNHERYVEDSVRSIWAQTYPNLELIVIDDGSRDATPDILRRLAADSPIPMRLEVQTNVGTTRTMNRAFSMANGEIIAFSASDDRLLPHHVETLVTALLAAPPETGLVFGDMYIIDENGKRTDRYFRMIKPRDGWVYEDFMLRRCAAPGLAAVVPAAVFREVGGYNENSQIDDIEFLMRIARKHPFLYVNSVVAEYRGQHQGERLGHQIDRFIPDYLRLFEEGTRDYEKARDPRWMRYARGHLYRYIGHFYYNVRELRKARHWLLRSVLTYPYQWTPWNLLIRSLLGARLLDGISSLKGRLFPPAIEPVDAAGVQSRNS